jgi:hypothetical protein
MRRKTHYDAFYRHIRSAFYPHIRSASLRGFAPLRIRFRILT